MRIADAVAPFGLSWLEIDTHDAPSLALIRSERIARSRPARRCAARRDFKPFFEAYAMDVAIVDVPWNGLAESVKIAAHGGRVRDQCRAAQFLRAPVQHAQRAFLRVGAELPDHGDRHRQRQLA